MEFIPRQITLAVSTTVIEVSPETGIRQRLAISLANASAGAQIIYLAWGQNAAVGSGIALRPGASWVEAIDQAFHPSNLRITVIADNAGAVLAVHERLG